MSIKIMWECDRCGTSMEEFLSVFDVGRSLWLKGACTWGDNLICEPCHEITVRKFMENNPGLVLRA